MQQIVQYRSGERDYTLIKGDTGPLVYPAGKEIGARRIQAIKLRPLTAHVYIYNALYRITDEGRDIFRAQCIFMVLYFAALTTVMSCYRMAKVCRRSTFRNSNDTRHLHELQVPPYIFPLLILSKRLHSIFLLRLFNDCFATLALFTAIYFFQRKIFTVGSVAFSFGLGIKMSVLLAAPAIGIILLQVLPFNRAANAIFLMAQVQFTLAVPFLSNIRGYLIRSFELSRVFLFKWTVNWRFIGEERFLSREFATALILLHLTLLITFVCTRWIRPSGLSIPALVSTALKPLPAKVQQQIYVDTTPSFIMTAILTSMTIGLLCARSLHYQFYAYIAWSTPFLLWKSGLHPILIYGVWAVQEWAWNVYPSTNTSSTVVVGCLAVQIMAVWQGTRDEYSDKIPSNPQDQDRVD